MTRRRDVIVGGSATLFGAALPASVHAQASKPFPLASELESGDLLWPKEPGTFIPYRYVGNTEPTADVLEWETSRDAAIAEIRKNLTMENVALLNELKDLTYARFRARYLNGSEPGTLVEYGRGGVAAVGHVAVVLIGSDSVPRVVEAVPPKVIVSTYDQWVAARPKEVVWQGRLRGKSGDERHAVAMEALKYDTRPYDFWKFNLDDETGFYCSKLVWLAAMRAIGLAVDGNPDPKRIFWLSPKQILNSDAIDTILTQGDYTFD